FIGCPGAVCCRGMMNSEFFVLLVLLPPVPARFPYPPLFRSQEPPLPEELVDLLQARQEAEAKRKDRIRYMITMLACATLPPLMRSEEHTSELQSRENLVCRLLL